ncbi:hypothetical protein CR513_03633, partial [Mucuna pruriens]
MVEPYCRLNDVTEEEKVELVVNWFQWPEGPIIHFINSLLNDGRCYGVGKYAGRHRDDTKSQTMELKGMVNRAPTLLLLIDSRAAHNFISKKLVATMG